jgi:CDP-diacylglycerol--serine O-phosphatidyltransferase
MTSIGSGKRRLRDRPRFRTGLSILPSLFTTGNIFAGYYSIASTLDGRYDAAAIAIFVGAVLDMLDGRIARLTGTSSEFGVQLDSLADVLTFGVAPAILALNWGIRSLAGLEAEVFTDVYKFGWLATFGYLIAGALRLARFNVSALNPNKPSSSRHFVGMPIPAAAGVIAAIVHFLKAPVEDLGASLIWCVLVATLAFLMVSTVRFPSFKDVDLKKPLPRAALLGAAMLIGLIAFYSEITLLVIAIIYLGSGPAARISQFIREHAGRDPDGRKRRVESHGDVS